MKHIGHSLDRVLVAYFNGPTAVGLYDSAYRWSMYPVHQVYGPLSNVVVASISRVQNDPAAYRAWCRAGLLPLFAIAMPAIAFMFSEARLVIRVLLGPQWMAAVPLFQVLCIAAFVNSVTRTTKWLLLSQDQTDRQFRWAFVDTAAMVIAVTVGARWGPHGVAIGFTVGTCLLAYPGLTYSLRHSHLSARDVLGTAARPALASLGAAVLLIALAESLSRGTLIVQLFLKLTAFALAYSAIWVTIPGGRRAFADVLRLAQEARRHLAKRTLDRAMHSGRK